MDVDVVLARIGKLFFFVSTLFIISISCAGGLYIESFAEELDVKYSVFEMDFNNLFLNVFIADQFQILLKTVLIVIAIVSFVYVYPKSLMLFYDFMYVLLNIFTFIVKEKILNKFGFNFKKKSAVKLNSQNAFQMKMRLINQKLEENNQYKVSSERASMNFMDFFKAMFLYLIMIYILLFWVYWNLDVGEQGKKYAQTYLKSTNYKTVVLINDTKLKAVLVSKVKSGYLFVLNENGKNNNKATIISDSAILRID